MTTMTLPTPVATIPKTRVEAETLAKMRIAVHIDTEVLHPEVARRKANVWLLMYAGNLLRADNPELITKDGLFWRYDVILTSPRRGAVGKVGQIHVHADTGEVAAADSVRDEYLQQAHLLLAQLEHEPEVSEDPLPSEHSEAVTSNAAEVAAG